MLRNIITWGILLTIWAIAALFVLMWLADGYAGFPVFLVCISALMTTLLFINERFELRPRKPERRTQPERTAKRKRTEHDSYTARMRALMDVMDADEQAAFKAAMQQRLLDDAGHRLSDDGEYAESLGELMQHHNRRH